MVRVKRGNVARKRRKKVFKRAKGFRGSLGKLFRSAKPAVTRAMVHATRHRKERKREMRSLWIARINAAARLTGMPYNKLIAALKKANSGLNRKSLAEMAFSNPAAFAKLVESVKS